MDDTLAIVLMGPKEML